MSHTSMSMSAGAAAHGSRRSSCCVLVCAIGRVFGALDLQNLSLPLVLSPRERGIARATAAEPVGLAQTLI